MDTIRAIAASMLLKVMKMPVKRCAEYKGRKREPWGITAYSPFIRQSKLPPAKGSDRLLRMIGQPITCGATQSGTSSDDTGYAHSYGL